MFRFLTLCVAAILGLAFLAADADAGIFRGTQVRVNNFGGGGANVNVFSRGGVFNRGADVRINNFGGFGGNSINVNSRGFLGRGANININNVGGAGVAFVPTGFGNNVAFVRGAAVTPFVFGGNNFAVNNIGLRINAFGTRTITDAGGNVFETDVFGNSAFRGNLFSRGFGGNTFIGVNSGGFFGNSFSTFGVGGGFCH